MVDVICLEDLDKTGAEYDDPIAELEQDLYHRLITPHGANIDDEDFGLGIEERLSAVADPAFAKQIEAEFRKDDRVTGVSVVSTQTADDTWRFDIEIEPQGSLVVEVNTKIGARRLA
jgi:phage baseplate assembly protein W